MKKTSEFTRVKQQGSVIRNPFFTMVYSKRDSLGAPRIGIVAGRKMGSAVTRNRLKRICRELVRGSYSEMVSGYACILYPKIKILRTPHPEVFKAWRGMLEDVGLLKAI